MYQTCQSRSTKASPAQRCTVTITSVFVHSDRFAPVLNSSVNTFSFFFVPLRVISHFTMIEKKKRLEFALCFKSQSGGLLPTLYGSPTHLFDKRSRPLVELLLPAMGGKQSSGVRFIFIVFGMVFLWLFWCFCLFGLNFF